MWVSESESLESETSVSMFENVSESSESVSESSESVSRISESVCEIFESVQECSDQGFWSRYLE